MAPKYSLKISHIEIQIFRMASDEETTKTKVVDFEELYNFIVDNFFIWNHLSKKNYVWISHIEIQNFQTTSDGETTKPKVVLLDNIYNFAVETLFI